MTIAIDNTIALTITDVTVVTKKIDWRYKKLTFPKLGDSGRATCTVSGCSIAVVMAVDLDGAQPDLRLVSPCEVVVGGLDLKIEGTAAKVGRLPPLLSLRLGE